MAALRHLVVKLVLIFLLVLARARENYAPAGSELGERGSCNLTATSHLRDRLPVLAAPGASPAAKGWGSVVITDAPTPKMWTWPIEATLCSLLVYAPAFLVNSLIIAFDGTETSLAPGAEQRGHYGSKCAGAANVTAYASYKTRVKALATNIFSTHRGDVRFVEPLARQCLAGMLSLAMKLVVTKYVLIMQSDISLTRAIDVGSLIGAMAARRANVVWLAIGSNKCNAALAQRACRINRPWVGPKSEAHDLLVMDEYPGMTAMSFWSDANHVASSSFYRDTVLPRIDEGKRQESLRAGGSLSIPRGSGFPEHFLFCEPWKNHSAWRTFLLGAPNDGNFSTHLDGRMAEGPGKPVQMHSCQGTRGKKQMGKSLRSRPHLIMGG